MAYTVVTAVTTTGKIQSSDAYERATSVDVRDGHLFVLEWDGAVFLHHAVYAPGKWVSASESPLVE